MLRLGRAYRSVSSPARLDASAHNTTAASTGSAGADDVAAASVDTEADSWHAADVDPWYPWTWHDFCASTTSLWSR